MTLGGSDGGDALLIGPILDWWEKRSAKKDAKRTAKAEAKARKSADPQNETEPDARR